MMTCEDSLHHYIEKLVTKFSSLTSHHFISKYQGSFLKSLKETINENECIILLDFAENYSFIVLDVLFGKVIWSHKPTGELLRWRICLSRRHATREGKAPEER